MNKIKYTILKKLDDSDESLNTMLLINSLKTGDHNSHHINLCRKRHRNCNANVLQKHLDDLVAQELVRYRDVTFDIRTPLIVTPKGRDYIDTYNEYRCNMIRSYVALACSFVSVAIAFLALFW